MKLDHEPELEAAAGRAIRRLYRLYLFLLAFMTLALLVPLSLAGRSRRTPTRGKRRRRPARWPGRTSPRF